MAAVFGCTGAFPGATFTWEVVFDQLEAALSAAELTGEDFVSGMQAHLSDLFASLRATPFTSARPSDDEGGAGARS